jgi:uncharacterized protein DUF4349
MHTTTRSLGLPMALLMLLLAAGCDGSSTPGAALFDEGAAEASERASEAPGLQAGEGAGDPGRKIIYSASLDLEVENYGEKSQRLRALLKNAGGYIVELREWHRDGRAGSGNWVLRIPATGLDSFLEAVGGLGAVQSRAIESEDVTARWADLERRIAVARKIEDRYVELLKSTQPDLDQTLQLEEKLVRVRAEIESQQGALRQLGEVVRYATLRLEMRSLWVAPRPRLGLGEETASAWNRSWTGLRQFGRALLIGLAALTPWLLAIAPLALILAYFWRFRRAK